MPPGSLWMLATVAGVAILALALGWAFWRSRQARKERGPHEREQRREATREAYEKPPPGREKP